MFFNDINKELVLAATATLTAGNPVFIAAVGTSWEVSKKIYEESNSNLQDHTSKVTHQFLMALYQDQDKILEEIKNDSAVSIAIAKLYDTMIVQRFEIKRQKAIIILRDFIYTKKDEREKFELEKMYHVLDLLSLEDLAVLNEFDGQLCLDEIVSSDVYAGLLSTGLIHLEIEYYKAKIDFEKDEFNSINPDMFDIIQNSLNDQIPQNMSLRYELTTFGQKFKDCILPINGEDNVDTDGDVKFVFSTNN
jgi:hypothetical protein